MYGKIIYPIVLVLIGFHACQLPLSNQSENNESEEPEGTTATVVHEEPDTIAQASPASFTLDEFGMLTEDDPWIYFLASVDEAKYRNHKYIYANGPDSLAFIHIDGKRHFLKTLEWFDVIDEEDEDMFELTTIDQSDEYDVKVVQKLEKREEASSTWTGNITVTRRADGAVYKSEIFGTSSH